MYWWVDYKTNSYLCQQRCSYGLFDDSGVSRGVLSVLEHPLKAQKYIKDLLRYLSLYQQVLPQTVIWEQKCYIKLCNR